MIKKLFDGGTTFAEIKNNNKIISALQEVMKVKNINIDIKDETTLQNIADQLNIDIKDLLLIVNKKNGLEKEFYEAYPDMKIDMKNNEPDWLKENQIVDLDVRDSLAKGTDPFGTIMQTITNLNGKVLHIVNTFEATPLYSVLGKQGFEHYSKNENGIWHIYFYKNIKI